MNDVTVLSLLLLQLKVSMFKQVGAACI